MGLKLYSIAKFITREVLIQEQIHYSDIFHERLFENYKKGQKFIRNKIIMTKVFGAIIFGVLPIIPLITYLEILQYLNNPIISIEIVVFGGSLIFSIFFMVQFFNFFLLAMINTTMVMSGKSFEWFESLPIPKKALKKLMFFTIFRSLDLPIIIILTAFPVIMLIGTLNIILFLICLATSVLNIVFSFFLLLMFAERMNRIIDINEINSKRAFLIRLTNLFSYIFIVVASVFLMQWVSNSLDSFFTRFIKSENSALVNLILTIIPFPLNSGYIIALFITPNQISIELWLNTLLGLATFIILTWAIFKKSIKMLDSAIFSKFKSIKKSFTLERESIVVKIKTTSHVKAFLRKDLIIASRDLKAFMSLVMPIFLSFVFTYSYTFINVGGISLLNRRELLLDWLFLFGFNLIISGITINGILNIEEANETIKASLPIIPRDQAKAKLLLIFLIQTLSIISPILLFVFNAGFIYFLFSILGILPIVWIFLIIMFEMRIKLFSKVKRYFVTEEITPENKIIKWAFIYIIVYLLFISFFYVLTEIYFNEGIPGIIIFFSMTFIVGLGCIILIFDNFFPFSREKK